MNQRRIKHLREYFSDLDNVDIFEDGKWRDDVYSYGVDELDSNDELCGGMGTYLVLTWEEAVSFAREDLIENFWERNYEIADALVDRQDIANAIDVKKWAEDQILCEQANSGHGLGGLLSTYDGEEFECIVDGKAMFIYRVD